MVRHNELARLVDDPDSDYFMPNEAAKKSVLQDRDEYTADGVFWIPEGHRWVDLRKAAKQADIGSRVDQAMEAIERENTTLKGVLPKNYTQRELNREAIGGLIDTFPGRTSPLRSSRASTSSAGSTSTSSASSPPTRARRPASSTRHVRSFSFWWRCWSPISAASSTRRVDRAACSSRPTSSSRSTVATAMTSLSSARSPSHDVAAGEDEPRRPWHRGEPRTRVGRHLPRRRSPRPACRLRDRESAVQQQQVGRRAVAQDPRWKYGVPPAQNANYAWLQHFLHHCAPTGTVGTVLANGSLSSQQNGEGEIRKAMVDADVVECIVALPPQLFYGTQIPVCLWFLTKNKAGVTSGMGARLSPQFWPDRSPHSSFVVS
jgi:type I restriction enzyme M protein